VVTKGRTATPRTTQAMLAAWDKMMGADELDRMNISARVDNPNGWLSVCCPNSGIHPVDHTIRAGHGYEFSFFGMENPFEQLTILAGPARSTTRPCKSSVSSATTTTSAPLFLRREERPFFYKKNHGSRFKNLEDDRNFCKISPSHFDAIASKWEGEGKSKTAH